MIKRIHINQHTLRSNTKILNSQSKANPEIGNVKPPVACRTSKGVYYGFEVDIQGDSKVVYSLDKPLSCGARLWIETNAPVIIDNLVVE